MRIDKYFFIIVIMENERIYFINKIEGKKSKFFCKLDDIGEKMEKVG